jgi:nucleoside-diphosphate-sugar epimerase
MTILVVGGSGATGRLLVEQLLNRGHVVKIILRGVSKLPGKIENHENLTTISASVLDLSDVEMAEHVKGCGAVASCLGHHMSFSGIYGAPQRLVTEATRRLCGAVRASNQERPVKFVLMNTSGNSNRDISERISFGQKCVILLLRLLLPPHVDNEKAADFLRIKVGQDDKAIEWAVVRPDNLVDEPKVTDYKVYSSPIRSAIFDAGITSRINVGHFMADLITNGEVWGKWKGQMPVIYNEKQV